MSQQTHKQTVENKPRKKKFIINPKVIRERKKVINPKSTGHSNPEIANRKHIQMRN